MSNLFLSSNFIIASSSCHRFDERFSRSHREVKRSEKKTKLRETIIHHKLKSSEAFKKWKQFMIEARINSRKYFTRESICLKFITRMRVEFRQIEKSGAER